MSGRADRRSLFRVALLIVSTVVFAVPAAAQGQVETETVFLGFGGGIVFMLLLCGVFAVFFSGYTRRATDQALADIGPVLKSGFAVTALILLPFVVAGAVALVTDGLGVGYLVIFGILGPLLVVPVVGGGLGFIVFARAVSDNWIVATVVVATLAGAIGAGVAVVPTLLLATLPLIAAGIGAMLREWRSPSTTTERKSRKPHPWEHRQP